MADGGGTDDVGCGQLALTLEVVNREAGHPTTTHPKSCWVTRSCVGSSHHLCGI
ncbi:hypothetical protein TIFTF001_045143 [Ficus carica]|uniref:Uncharacterized protein n=1 Tax=Ficus carica TaxID=3494 RepID=A0AA88CJU9_FICCA|nr:hypothetical protein TIFTF001_045143 [Ficus carica]